MQYIPPEVWKDFVTKYAHGDVVEIAQGLTTTLILVIPSAKIDRFKISETFHTMRDEYYGIVHQYTDEQVASPNQIVMSILSEEEFGANYQRNWYYVFR